MSSVIIHLVTLTFEQELKRPNPTAPHDDGTAVYDNSQSNEEIFQFQTLNHFSNKYFLLLNKN